MTLSLWKWKWLKLLAVAALYCSGVLTCAQSEPASNPPEPASAPSLTASMADSVEMEDATRGRFFVVMAINGQRVANSYSESMRASRGKGLALTAVQFARSVAVGQPLVLKLFGGHVSAAPILAMANDFTNSNYWVDGEITFTAKEGGNYVVKGQLEVTGSSVWVEDQSTGLRVSEVLLGKPAIKGPATTFEVPDLAIQFDCGDCKVNANAAQLIRDAYVKRAFAKGAKLSEGPKLAVIVEHYIARSLADRFLSFTPQRDEIRARVAWASRTFFVEDYYRNPHFGADTLAGNIGEMIFDQWVKP